MKTWINLKIIRLNEKKSQKWENEYILYIFIYVKIKKYKLLFRDRSKISCLCDGWITKGFKDIWGGDSHNCNFDCGDGLISVCIYAQTGQITYFKSVWALVHEVYLSRSC